MKGRDEIGKRDWIQSMTFRIRQKFEFDSKCNGKSFYSFEQETDVIKLDL